MSASECQVRLHRDALSTQWGFRLQGGKDFKAPLTVQRVFAGSPADGELHRGDVISSIENYDAMQMIHKQAMDVIKQAGGSISFRVRRSQGVVRPVQTAAALPKLSAPRPTLPTSSQFRSRPFDGVGSPPKPSAMSGYTGYGSEYRGVAAQQQQYRPVSDPMLNRVQHSLNQAVWNPSQQNNDEEYEPMCVNDLKRVFNQPVQRPAVQQQHQQRPYTYNAKPSWQKPEQNPILRGPKGLSEPGWSPSSAAQPGWSPVNPQQQASRYQPQQQASRYQPQQPSGPAPRPVNARPQPPEPVHIEPSRPAWAGSLKSSGGPKPWEMRTAEALGGQDAVEHQPAHASRGGGGGGGGPAPAPVQQHSPQQQQQVPVHQPRVQNVHYGPGGSAPEYQQHDPNQHQDSDTAQVKHLQYNSPLGLYSKDNVSAVLQGQTQGKPGQGTLQVTGGGPSKPFNPTTSDVYKLLLEEETRSKSHSRRGGGGSGQPQPQQQQQSARYEDQAGGEMQYHGYQDHSKQSPAIGRLEQRIADGTVGMDQGTSDF